MKGLAFLSLALGLLVLQSEAKYYNENVSINGRVPGDQLLFHSSHAVQNLNFYASVHVEVRYPDNLPHSNYILSHVELKGKDDSGYIDVKFNEGGPGADYMKMQMIFNSIQNADFEMFIYGKKK